jgi:hypothetical protein
MNAAYVISALSLALCCLFCIYFRRYIKRRTSTEELLAEYRTEVYRLIAEIDAATDRDALLVEERIGTLKKILEDTDKRIAVYVRELDRSRSGEALYTSLGRGIRAALGPQAPSAGTGPGSPETAPVNLSPEFAGPPEAADGPAPRPQSVKAAKKKRGAASRPAEDAAKPRLKARIAELAAGGLSPAEIASRLDVSLSEVDLALSLLGRGAR